MPPRPLASLGDRLIGQVLDSLVALAAVVAGLIPNLVSDTTSGATMFAGVGFALFYVLFSDGLAGGQSWGKKAIGTAVIDATTGRPCTFFQSFLRNLLLTALGFIDWVFIFGQKRQRLGDKAANTIVVKITA